MASTLAPLGHRQRQAEVPDRARLCP